MHINLETIVLNIKRAAARPEKREGDITKASALTGEHKPDFFCVASRDSTKGANFILKECAYFPSLVLG